MKKAGIMLLAMLFVVGAAFATDLAKDNEARIQAIVEAHFAGDHVSMQDYALLKAVGMDISAETQHNTALIGGPDPMGYTFADTDDGAVYDWMDITATGADISAGVSDDNTIGPFTLGFSFPFYGATYSEFWVQSNGSVSFDGDYITLSNASIPTASYGPMVAWMWDDLDPGDDFNAGDAPILFEEMMIGDQMAAVIQFNNYDEFPGGDASNSITAQVILFENGVVKVQYNAIDDLFDLNGSTIGINPGDGVNGLQVQYNGLVPAYPAAGTAIEFNPGAGPDANLSGLVTDMSNVGIEGATVVVGANSTTTDAMGAYSFTGLFGGTYSYAVSAPGYMSATGTVDLVTGDNFQDFQLGENTPQADVLIVDVDETPDSGPAVQAYIEGLGFTTYYTNVFDASDFSAGYDAIFLFTGIYPNDFAMLTDSPEEAMCVNYINSGGNFFMEGGDQFSYTPPTNLIAAMGTAIGSDGGSDLTNVLGVAGGPFDGFDGLYNGENNWMDEIALAGAIGVCVNSADGPDVYNMTFFAGAGNAVGASFETGMTDGFGDLVDGTLVFFGMMDPPDPDPLTVTLTPTGDPFVPAAGGTLNFDVGVVSTIPNAYPGVWFFTTLMLPNGNMYPPNLFQTQFNLPANADVGGNLNQNIPAFAPSGFYTLYGTVAGNPQGIGPNFSGSFDFEKAAGTMAGNPVNDWNVTGSLNIAGDAEIVNLPVAFELAKVYPNPFNPTANVSVALPTAADLTVAVYNVMGQQVAELASGQVQAGTHNFVLDGSNLSSGIYFVQATVPGELNAVQKVTLMK